MKDKGKRKKKGKRTNLKLTTIHWQKPCKVSMRLDHTCNGWITWSIPGDHRNMQSRNMILEINYNDGQQIIRFYDQGNIGREN